MSLNGPESALCLEQNNYLQSVDSIVTPKSRQQDNQFIHLWLVWDETATTTTKTIEQFIRLW